MYLMFAVMGLTYNPRASTVYLYAVELLPSSTRLLFGSTLFFIDGCISVSAAVYFYYWKNQNLLFFVIAALLTLSIVLMHFILPETP